MPRYTVLMPSFLEIGGAAGGRLVAAGETIEYDGDPGASLYPADAEAYAARERVLATRNPEQRERDDRMVRIGLAGLPKHKRMEIERVAATLGATP